MFFTVATSYPFQGIVLLSKEQNLMSLIFSQELQFSEYLQKVPIFVLKKRFFLFLIINAFLISQIIIGPR